MEGMYRKLEWYAAAVANAFLDTSGQGHVNAVAGGEIPAGLSNPNDGPPALQFLARNAVVVETLEINRSLTRFRSIVKPDLAAKCLSVSVTHIN